MQLIAWPGTQYSFPYLREPRLDSNRVHSLSIFHSYCVEFRCCMETSLITPCYDTERLETMTHMGLDPGESIEYNKHRVSPEGHPWPGCHPVSDTCRTYSMDRPRKKEGLEKCWSSEPIRLLLKQKVLWPARQGHPGCKILQMWMARTSRPPQKCLKWTPRWTMPRKRRCLWWNGL